MLMQQSTSWAKWSSLFRKWTSFVPTMPTPTRLARSTNSGLTMSCSLIPCFCTSMKKRSGPKMFRYVSATALAALPSRFMNALGISPPRQALVAINPLLWARSESLSIRGL